MSSYNTEELHPLDNLKILVEGCDLDNICVICFDSFVINSEAIKLICFISICYLTWNLLYYIFFSSIYMNFLFFTAQLPPWLHLNVDSRKNVLSNMSDKCQNDVIPDRSLTMTMLTVILRKVNKVFSI